MSHALKRLFHVSPDDYVEVMTTKHLTNIRSQTCPECLEIDTIRKIVYGMPDPESFDFEKYAVGGCCISGDGTDPYVQCKSCDWFGFRRDLI